MTFAGASSDGSRVFFSTFEPLASTDTDASRDLYMREGNTTTHVSQGAINGNGAIGVSFAGASNDGSRVFFSTTEQLASTDTDASTDIYMREGNTTTHVSRGAINGNGAFHASFEGASTDGSRVFFSSDEQLASTDTDASRDVYMREGNTTTHVSRGAINGNGAFLVEFAGASSDGSRVFFHSNEQLASTDTDASTDVYMREGSTTTHLSRGAINGNGAFGAFFVGASSDGSRVFFTSIEPLASTDTDASRDIYMREGSTTTHVSRGAINGNGAFDVEFEGASSDGSQVFFTSFEPLASTDTDASRDIYMREGNTTTHVSQGAINGNGAFDVTLTGASSDGSRLFFVSFEPLASTDTDTSQDIYMREGNITTHLSQGEINGNGAFEAVFRGASSDGSRLIFESNEPLASTDTDAFRDIYMREGNTTIHVSQGAINGNGAFAADFERASSDGSRVFFTTNEQLASTDTDASQDVFAATIDSTPPQTTIDSGPAEGSTTNNPSPTFAFSADESPSSFQCRLYATGAAAPAFGACSGPGDAHTPPVALADGNYTFEVVATDATGNTDPTPAARSFTIDTTTVSDTEITDAKLKVKRVQKQGKKVKVKLKASAGEPVDLLAKGKIKLKGKAKNTKALKGKRKAVKLKSLRRTAAAGERVKLVLKPAKKKDQRKVLRALGRGKKANAKVSVRFSDAAGNKRVLKAKVKLKLR